MPKLAVSVEEAAQMIGLGRTKTWALISSGQIEVVRIGRRTLCRVDSLHKLIDGVAA